MLIEMSDAPWHSPTGMDKYLQATRLVDSDASIVRDAAARIYHYCRDEIRFGYNRRDDIPASEVLCDGYGQCNTKSILLVALLRAASIPARFHLTQVDKAVQWGVMPWLAYPFAPDAVTHSWAEVYLDGCWPVLKGVIMDRPYSLAARQLLL